MIRENDSFAVEVEYGAEDGEAINHRDCDGFYKAGMNARHWPLGRYAGEFEAVAEVPKKSVITAAVRPTREEDDVESEGVEEVDADG